MCTMCTPELSGGRATDLAFYDFASPHLCNHYPAKLFLKAVTYDLTMGGNTLTKGWSSHPSAVWGARAEIKETAGLFAITKFMSCNCFVQTILSLLADLSSLFYIVWEETLFFLFMSISVLVKVEWSKVDVKNNKITNM